MGNETAIHTPGMGIEDTLAPAGEGAGWMGIKRLVYVSGINPGGGILFCAFLFFFLLALFLQALCRFLF
jgi:hypothetical protein